MTGQVSSLFLSPRCWSQSQQDRVWRLSAPPWELSPSHRDEIAGCIEKAYEKILFAEATRILFFNTPKKMTDYAKKVVDWSWGMEGAVPFSTVLVHSASSLGETGRFKSAHD